MTKFRVLPRPANRANRSVLISLFGMALLIALEALLGRQFQMVLTCSSHLRASLKSLEAAPLYGPGSSILESQIADDLAVCRGETINLVFLFGGAILFSAACVFAIRVLIERTSIARKSSADCNIHRSH